jgi:serine/threonine protein kinase
MNTSLLFLLVFIILLPVLAVWVSTLVWVYRDAERCGKPGILVALLVGLLVWPVGLLVWLILRQDYLAQALPPLAVPPLLPPGNCPQCGRVLASSSTQGLCPACLLRQVAFESVAPGSGLAGFTPPAAAELAELFPQFESLELLGRGGMGAVYKARQTSLDRFVALKILPAEANEDPAFGERFQREARALAQLSHPNIVGVHDFGQAGAYAYLVMEFVDGANLRQLQRGGHLSPSEALAIVPQICEALQFAHDHGIVHRDIKPENILIDTQGRVKIADFGLAKMMRLEAGAPDLTLTRHAIGTPQYMAPEQIEKPETVDHRADIYSLGVVFYEMLTGELPIGRFSSPSQRVEVDVRLDEVVLKALEKDPSLRYQQASAFKTEVETVAGGTPAASVSGTDDPTNQPPAYQQPAAHAGIADPAPLARGTVPPARPSDTGTGHGSVRLSQSTRIFLDVVAVILVLSACAIGFLRPQYAGIDDTGPFLLIAACFIIAVTLAFHGRWNKKGVYLAADWETKLCPTVAPHHTQAANAPAVPVHPPSPAVPPARQKNSRWWTCLQLVLGSTFLFLSYMILNRVFGMARDELFSLMVAVAGLVLVAVGAFNAVKERWSLPPLVLGFVFLFLSYMILNRVFGMARDELFSLVFAAVGLVLVAVGVFKSFWPLLAVVVCVSALGVMQLAQTGREAGPAARAPMPLNPFRYLFETGRAFRPAAMVPADHPLVVNLEIRNPSTNIVEQVNLFAKQRAFTDIIRLPPASYIVAGAVWPDQDGGYTLDVTVRNYPDDTRSVGIRKPVTAGVSNRIGKLQDDEFFVTLTRVDEAAASDTKTPVQVWWLLPLVLIVVAIAGFVWFWIPDARQAANESAISPDQPKLCPTAIWGVVQAAICLTLIPACFQLQGDQRTTAILALVAVGCSTAICGAIAISQIRRSEGKLYGMGLAVFDLVVPVAIAAASVVFLF